MFQKKPKHVDLDKLLEMTSMEEVYTNPQKKQNTIVNVVEELVVETKIKPSIQKPLVKKTDEILWLS